MSYMDCMILSINMCLYVLPLLFITRLSCFTPHYKRHKECITKYNVDRYIYTYLTYIYVYTQYIRTFSGDLKATAINGK